MARLDQLRRYQRDIHEADETIESVKNVTAFWESALDALDGLTGDEFANAL